MKRNVLFMIAAILLSFSPALAMERFDIITTQELKQMLDDRASGKIDFILVNALDEIIFRNSSIPGSVNLPWCKINQTAYRLGEDKDRLIIIY